MRAISQVKKLKDKDNIGCNKRLTFMLKKYNNHECRVYRRVRWEDDKKKRKYKDWKIKVVQLQEPKSWDYLVVYKLPCSLKYIEQFLQEKLKLQYLENVIPNPI